MTKKLRKGMHKMKARKLTNALLCAGLSISMGVIQPMAVMAFGEEEATSLQNTQETVAGDDGQNSATNSDGSDESQAQTNASDTTGSDNIYFTSINQIDNDNETYTQNLQTNSQEDADLQESTEQAGEASDDNTQEDIYGSEGSGYDEIEVTGYQGVKAGTIKRYCLPTQLMPENLTDGTYTIPVGLFNATESYWGGSTWGNGFPEKSILSMGHDAFLDADPRTRSGLFTDEDITGLTGPDKAATATVTVKDGKASVTLRWLASVGLKRFNWKESKNGTAKGGRLEDYKIIKIADGISYTSEVDGVSYAFYKNKETAWGTTDAIIEMTFPISGEPVIWTEMEAIGMGSSAQTAMLALYWDHISKVKNDTGDDSDQDTYSITVEKSENGSVTADKGKAVKGDTVTLTGTPEEGYELSQITVKAGENTVETKNESDGTVVFSMPGEDVTVSAVFSKSESKWPVTINRSSNGTVTADKKKAQEGETVTLTAVAAKGYELSGVEIKAGDNTVKTTTQSDGSITFVMPAGEVTVSASFEKAVVKYRVTIDDMAHGTITADKESAQKGETVTLKVSPESDYSLYSLKVEEGRNLVQTTEKKKGTLTFLMPEGDVTVTASFTNDNLVVQFNKLKDYVMGMDPDKYYLKTELYKDTTGTGTSGSSAINKEYTNLRKWLAEKEIIIEENDNTVPEVERNQFEIDLLAWDGKLADPTVFGEAYPAEKNLVSGKKYRVPFKLYKVASNTGKQDYALNTVIKTPLGYDKKVALPAEESNLLSQDGGQYAVVVMEPYYYLEKTYNFSIRLGFVNDFLSSSTVKNAQKITDTAAEGYVKDGTYYTFDPTRARVYKSGVIPSSNYNRKVEAANGYESIPTDAAYKYFYFALDTSSLKTNENGKRTYNVRKGEGQGDIYILSLDWDHAEEIKDSESEEAETDKKILQNEVDAVNARITGGKMSDIMTKSELVAAYPRSVSEKVKESGLLEEAQDVLNDKYATQTQVNEAVTNLENAFIKENTLAQELNRLSIYLAEMNPDNYTKGSYETLKNYKDLVQKVIADPSVLDAPSSEGDSKLTKEDRDLLSLVDAEGEKVSTEPSEGAMVYQNFATTSGKTAGYDRMYERFLTLEDALVYIVDLKEAVKLAEDTDLDQYTKASVAEFKSAIYDAKKVLENDNASQEEVDKAITALSEAKNNLKIADKTELTKAISEAEALVKNSGSDYTETSLNSYRKAIDAARGVNEDAGATQTDVDEAVKTLENMKSVLEKKADKSALKSAIDASEKVVQDTGDEYTQTSLESYQDFIDKAQKVYDDDIASQADVDAAVTELDNAKAVLTKKADKTKLKEAIDKAEEAEKSSDTYTDASVALLKNALSNAKDVYDNRPNASQTEVDEATAELQNTVNNLTRKTNTGGNISGVLDKNNLADGTYTVGVNLWNASKDQASMGNAALYHTGTLTVKDGKYTLQVSGHQMTQSGQTGELDALRIVPDGSTPLGDGSNYKELDISKDASDVYVEFEIENSDDVSEYYYSGIKVHTVTEDGTVGYPMGTDWVPSRLRISWDSLALKESTEEYPAFSATDEATGVTVSAKEGALPKGTKLRVTKVTGDDKTKGSDVILKNLASKNTPYEISLYTTDADGNETAVEPKNDMELTITLPVPSDYDTSKLGCYYIDENGYANALSNGLLNQKDGTYTVTNSKIGMYAITEKIARETTYDNSGYPAFSATDTATGVSVTAAAGVIPEGTVLEVTKITGSAAEKIDSILAKVTDKNMPYEITLYKVDADGNKTKIEPRNNQAVTITLPVPDSYDKTKLGAYYIDENSKAYVMNNGSLSGKSYSFQTNHLSTYVISEKKTSSSTGSRTGVTTGTRSGTVGVSSGARASGGSGTTSGTTRAAGAKTGDETNVAADIIAIMLAMTALAGILVISRRKRQMR